MTSVWEAQDTMGHGGLELRLQWRRKLAARRMLRGEAQVVSGKNPARWQRHRLTAP
jgi:hypothetical protein